MLPSRLPPSTATIIQSHSTTSLTLLCALKHLPPQPEVVLHAAPPPRALSAHHPLLPHLLHGGVVGVQLACRRMPAEQESSGQLQFAAPAKHHSVQATPPQPRISAPCCTPSLQLQTPAPLASLPAPPTRTGLDHALAALLDTK